MLLTEKARSAKFQFVALTVVLALGLFAWGCGSNLILSARTLDVYPNPAVPGDTVIFVAIITVVPSQDFTVVALIDSVEHASVSELGIYDGAYSLTVGETADLIGLYGEGTHTARLEVRLDQRGKSAGTREVSFTLSATP